MVLTANGEVVLLLCTAVEAQLVDEDATVHIKQLFKNPWFGSEGTEEAEAIYSFPLQPTAAVYSFKSSFLAESGEILKTLVGKAREKQEAREQFEQAKANGHSTSLLEQNGNSPDIFQFSVGNIPMEAQSVRVEISYHVTVPTEEQGAVSRFLFPASIVARFGEKTTNGFSGVKVAANMSVFSMKVKLTRSGEISLIESPTHNIATVLMIDDSRNKAEVNISLNTETLKKDFVLKIGSASSSNRFLVQNPQSIENEGFTNLFGDSTIAKATFVCNPPPGLGHEIKKKFVFLVDRSGSMSGASMRNCKKALSLCLSSLPEDCLFEICSFGSSHSFLFNGGAQYSEATLSQAREHVESMSADMGGTSIYSPLEAIFATHTDTPLVVFLLTDGRVSNTAAIIELVKESHNSHGTRMFTCGIGSGASTHLVEGAAKVGGGTATSISYGERMNAKMAAQMEQAIREPFADLRVELGSLQNSAATLAWGSDHLLSYGYSGQKVSVYLAIDSGSLVDLNKRKDAEEDISPIKLFGHAADGNQVLLAEIEAVNGILVTDANLIIPALRQQISLTEDIIKQKKKEKKRAVDLAIAANLASTFTSLVAVDDNGGATNNHAQIHLSKKISKSKKAKMGRGGSKQKEKKNSKRNFGASLIDPLTQIHENKSFMVHAGEAKRLHEDDQEMFRKEFDSLAVLSEKMIPQVKDKEPEQLGEYETLDLLVSLQKGSGEFQESAELLRALGCESLGPNASAKGFASAVIIVFLEERLNNLRDEWGLIHKKTASWVAKNAENEVEIMKLATSFVRTL